MSGLPESLAESEMDQEMIRQINDLRSLKEEERAHILRTLGALIRDAKAREAYGV